MMLRTMILVFLVSGSALLYSFMETDKKLHYDVIRNGKVIGYLDALRKNNGEKVEYIMESNVKVSVIMDFALYSKVMGSFDTLLGRSTLISKTGEKDRNRFFNSMRQKVNSLGS